MAFQVAKAEVAVIQGYLYPGLAFQLRGRSHPSPSVNLMCLQGKGAGSLALSVFTSTKVATSSPPSSPRVPSLTEEKGDSPEHPGEAMVLPRP